MEMLGANYTTVFRSPNPKEICAYSPSVIKHRGKIIVSMDAGGKSVATLDNVEREGKLWRGRIYISDDDGKSFRFVDSFPFEHARLFADGDDAVYIIGQCHECMIIRSTDGGETWEPPVALTEGEYYHAAPTNYIEHNGYIYLTMEKDIHRDMTCWNVGSLTPVVLKGKKGTDLTKKENWIFSKPMSFRQAVKANELDYFGVPFYATPETASELYGRARCAPPGWLETNIVKIYDKSHYWYDENCFHLFMRAHTGGTNYACMLKIREHEDGSLTPELETVPSGKKILFIPMPGGQMKFHILYDEVSKMYWLLSTQATDSMTRAELLPEDRFNLPNNERQRLQLHFSKNMVDWRFAGMVDQGNAQREARHYAAMSIDGDDLIIASRSGDKDSNCAHDCNLLTFHRINNFRDLIY